MFRDYEKISPDIVCQVLYDDGSGRLRWRKFVGCRGLKGDIAGSMHIVKCEIRWTIQIRGHKYLRSRLVWVLNTGRWPRPGMIIDHKDKDTSNDRFDNLREITQQQNVFHREGIHFDENHPHT